MSNNIDRLNSQFWTELCGSSLARQLGIRDHSLESLRRFDEAYLDFYPYLLEEVPLHRFSGRKVLEIGLGYGTLGQKIVEQGAEYAGLDIAEGPVRMMKHRLSLQKLPGVALQGSILQSPFADGEFDAVVSIGCFHHTGSVETCIRETFRLLKPGGMACLMLYNRFSLRQWLKWPLRTLSALAGNPERAVASEAQRGSYDVDASGKAAPETTFHSIRELGHLFAPFSSVRFSKRNCDGISLVPRLGIPREYLLSSVGRLMGLDIYIQAVK